MQRIYTLLDAKSNVEWRQFDSPHNYHQDSREAVYQFFGKHVLGDAESAHFAERSSRPDQLSELLYLWGRALPEGAVSHEQLVRQRIAAAEADTLALAIDDAASLANARSAFKERLSLALLAEVPAPGVVEANAVSGPDLAIGRGGIGDRIPARFLNADSRKGSPVLFVHAGGAEAAAQSEVGKALARGDAPMLLIDAFQTGSAATERDIAAVGRNAERYYHVFNRSDDANRVQDILTAAAFLRSHTGSDSISLVASGRAGLWVLLAASLDSGIGAVVADLDNFDATNDAGLRGELVHPGTAPRGRFPCGGRADIAACPGDAAQRAFRVSDSLVRSGVRGKREGQRPVGLGRGCALLGHPGMDRAMNCGCCEDGLALARPSGDLIEGDN